MSLNKSSNKFLILKVIIIALASSVIVFSITLVSINKIKDDTTKNNEETNSNITTLNNEDEVIKKQIDYLNEKADSYQKSIDDSTNSIANDIDRLKEQVSILSTNNNEVLKRNSALNNEITVLKNELSSLQDIIGKQQNDINALKSSTTNQIIGSIIAYAGNTLPENFLECNGQEISRTTYADLFSIIGTTYGGGDGSSTFNLPNLNDRFPMASSSLSLGSNVQAGIPNITGSIVETPYPVNPVTAGVPSITGAFKNSVIGSSNGWTDGGSGRKPVTTKNFSAADGETHNVGGANTYRNDVYGKSDTVQPPALVIKYIIKVKD